MARFIDHTLLKADAGPFDVDRICHEALEWEFRAVCVNPVFVPLAARLLDGSSSSVCTVVGFPLGAARSEVKAFEAAMAVQEGATELDMVLPVGFLVAGDEKGVVVDVEAVVKAAGDRLVKVILETSELNEDRIARACRLCAEAGAHFVKTSTGFGSSGATETHVRLMRETVKDSMGVKASGGIGTYREALGMLKAGASRIGASAGISIVQGR
ncbi:MAG: deoxyribose-phosphate aldolase [Planctomycetota bacterium]